jgi:hypothetical protein
VPFFKLRALLRARVKTSKTGENVEEDERRGGRSLARLPKGREAPRRARWCTLAVFDNFTGQQYVQKRETRPSPPGRPAPHTGEEPFGGRQKLTKLPKTSAAQRSTVNGSKQNLLAIKFFVKRIFYLFVY